VVALSGEHAALVSVEVDKVDTAANAGIGVCSTAECQGELPMNADELLKKEPKSDAELIAFLAVTRISRGLPIGVIMALPPSELTPDRVYESLLKEARALWDWEHNHIDRRTRDRRGRA
jgi:hypothetical protein